MVGRGAERRYVGIPSNNSLHVSTSLIYKRGPSPFSRFLIFTSNFKILFSFSIWKRIWFTLFPLLLLYISWMVKIRRRGDVRFVRRHHIPYVNFNEAITKPLHLSLSLLIHFKHIFHFPISHPLYPYTYTSNYTHFIYTSPSL